jgi:hypothetical protein
MIPISKVIEKSWLESVRQVQVTDFFHCATNVIAQELGYLFAKSVILEN